MQSKPLNQTSMALQVMLASEELQQQQTHTNSPRGLQTEGREETLHIMQPYKLISKFPPRNPETQLF